MKRIQIKATLTVEVELNGVKPEEIKSNIRQDIQRLFGEGSVTGSSDAEVDSWNLVVESKPIED